MERPAPQSVDEKLDVIGRQYRGHPVFVAQHATATCCRTCLLRWHQIPKGRELNRGERDYVVEVIFRWIQREMAGPEGAPDGPAGPPGGQAGPQDGPGGRRTGRRGRGTVSRPAAVRG